MSVYVGHGMTTATNALLQRSGARIAFITNEGFRDLLLIGRQNRPSLYDIRKTRPEPLVAPRGLPYGARPARPRRQRDRAARRGRRCARIAERLRADGVAAVAICFLHAYANPAHERRARAILTEALPGVPVCLSTDILAEFREYERASTVALNAYVLPVMEGYLASLTELLADPAEGLGLAADVPVMVMEAAGGLMTVASARATSRCTRCCPGRPAGSSRAPMSRRCRVSPTSSRWTWAAPAPTSAWCSTAARR